jgi:xanthine phosphoribosyltransferase
MPVATLKERILRDAYVLGQDVVQLDSILNQQVDSQLSMEMGREFAARFQEVPITKVITVESSGIPVAFATAYTLGVPLIFARRKRSAIGDPDSYSERVASFTKGMVTDIIVSKQFLSASDHILFIDDIIANGGAAQGLLKIIDRSPAQLAGIGIVVEKAFQKGAAWIREQGVPVETLVTITSLDDGEIHFD